MALLDTSISRHSQRLLAIDDIQQLPKPYYSKVAAQLTQVVYNGGSKLYTKGGGSAKVMVIESGSVDIFVPPALHTLFAPYRGILTAKDPSSEDEVKVIDPSTLATVPPILLNELGLVVPPDPTAPPTSETDNQPALKGPTVAELAKAKAQAEADAQALALKPAMAAAVRAFGGMRGSGGANGRRPSQRAEQGLSDTLDRTDASAQLPSRLKRGDSERLSIGGSGSGSGSGPVRRPSLLMAQSQTQSPATNVDKLLTSSATTGLVRQSSLMMSQSTRSPSLNIQTSPVATTGVKMSPRGVPLSPRNLSPINHLSPITPVTPVDSATPLPSRAINALNVDVNDSDEDSDEDGDAFESNQNNAHPTLPTLSTLPIGLSEKFHSAKSPRDSPSQPLAPVRKGSFRATSGNGSISSSSGSVSGVGSSGPLSARGSGRPAGGMTRSGSLRSVSPAVARIGNTSSRRSSKNDNGGGEMAHAAANAAAAVLEGMNSSRRGSVSTSQRGRPAPLSSRSSSKNGKPVDEEDGAASSRRDSYMLFLNLVQSTRMSPSQTETNSQTNSQHPSQANSQSNSPIASPRLTPRLGSASQSRSLTPIPADAQERALSALDSVGSMESDHGEANLPHIMLGARNQSPLFNHAPEAGMGGDELAPRNRSQSDATHSPSQLSNSSVHLTPLPLNAISRLSNHGQIGQIGQIVQNEQGVDGDVFTIRVGPGCVLGGGVLPSLLGAEGAMEWKDEVRNGVPNVGCEAGATAVAASER